MDAAAEEPPDFLAIAEFFAVDPTPIGAGAFASVFFALKRGTSKMVALKVMNKTRVREMCEESQSTSSWRTLIDTEIDLTEELATLRHRNLCDCPVPPQVPPRVPLSPPPHAAVRVPTMLDSKLRAVLPA